MGRHVWAIVGALVTASGLLQLPSRSAHADASASAVKDPTLLTLRGALAHYTLEPDGTAAQLSSLQRLASRLAAQPEAQEALFLRAAVASDLWFIAQFRRDAVLSAAVARGLGVAPARLEQRIEQALRQAAQGVYREPAQLAIQALRGSGEQPMGATPGPRSDALLLRRAIAAAKSPQPRESLAALGVDPCATRRCSEDYAVLDAHSRACRWYLSLVAAAEKRLLHAADVGDPLAEALLPVLQAERQDLPADPLQLLPELAGVAVTLPDGAAASPLGHLDRLIVLDGTQLKHVSLPAIHFGPDGIRFEPSAPHAPGKNPVSIDAWAQTLARKKPGGVPVRLAPPWSVGVVATATTPGHTIARLLLSLAKAGVQSPQLLARTPRGELSAVKLHIADPASHEPQPRVDLTLHVRVGGFVIRAGSRELDLPAAHRAGARRYDLRGLQRALAGQRFQTAALSFVPDVTAEQVLSALAQLPTRERALELALR